MLVIILAGRKQRPMQLCLDECRKDGLCDGHRAGDGLYVELAITRCLDTVASA